MTFTNAQVALQQAVTLHSKPGTGFAGLSTVVGTANAYLEWLNAQEPDKPKYAQYPL